MPKLGANDEAARLVHWARAAGDLVAAHDVVCEVETTKAVVEVEAERAGYLRPLVEIDALLPIGAVLAAITATAEEDVSALLPRDERTPAPEPERRWTKKAEIVARRLGVDIGALAAQNPGTLIGEAEVLAFQPPRMAHDPA
jgi:pyruvate/2-oxoglutarate dehydrogenase complex dihydrolipoamide acyltransferase (E2) component